MLRVFRDRHDAGVQLARALQCYADAADVVVLAHARCSIPVAYEVAMRLALPLDVIACEDTDDGDALRDLTLDLARRSVIVVDDGDRARELPHVIETLREHDVAGVIAAVAVAAPHVFARLQVAADDVRCVLTPQHIYAVEAWYADLTEPTAEEARELLVAAARSQLSVTKRDFLIDHVDS